MPGEKMDPMARRQTLGDLLRRTAQRTPEKVAVVCGDVSWTYAGLDEICSRLASGFARLGLRVGDRVAVLARNSHAFAVTRFAIARLGAVLVPVNFMLNETEIAFILKHAGAVALCADSEFAAIGRRAAALDTRVREFIWLPGEERTEPPADFHPFDDLATSPAGPSAAQFDGASVAQIIYTSGTESLPKGAVLTHDAVIWQYVSCLVDAEITADDRLLHALPLYHCAQLDVFLGPGIYCGATNVITARPIPDNLLTLIERHGITSFFAPPTVWISLLRAPAFDSTDLSGLRKAYYGAAIMPVPVLLEIQKRLPRLRLWNLYGQTEIAPLATVLKPEDQLRKAGSAGRPALNVETRVVNDAGDPVLPGEIGEIVHRSPQLISEYFHDPARTDSAFAGGWFHSGDLATVDEEGYITVVDRKKDMVKTGGENVASREVEEVIYRMEGVSEVAVIGVPHPQWIEAVVAVIVAKSGHDVHEEAVAAHCRSQMAGFKIPKRIMVVESLPKNPSGKVLKRELRERFGDLMSDR
jgi:fatty-acyl-CoA synthase